MAEPVILTNDELRVLCDEWQRVLGLQDWHVTIRRARMSEMRERHTGGQAQWLIEKKIAVVFVVDPEDFVNACNQDFCHVQDMEYTVVHELMHLHFVPLGHVTQGDVETRFVEQAIHAAALALVNLKRRTVNGGMV